MLCVQIGADRCAGRSVLQIVTLHPQLEVPSGIEESRGYGGRWLEATQVPRLYKLQPHVSAVSMHGRGRSLV